MRPQFPRELKCDYHPNRSGLPVEEIAPLIDAVIAPYYAIGESSSYFGQQGESLQEIVHDLTGADTDDIANDVIDQLIEDDPADPRDGGEPFYQTDQLYVRHDDPYNPHSEAWNKFKSEIKYNQRFFSELARQRLQDIFKDIHLQRDKTGRPVVYKLLPDAGVKIYRARQIDDFRRRKEAINSPASQLACPPRRLRTAGRMNAAGVGAFYGAFDLDTCIAEIRPAVGAAVVGAAFEPVRPIVVLDLTRFASPIQDRSRFSPVYEARSLQWGFMQSFMAEISKPILPNDVTLDYIPSQAVSEFIHSYLKVKLDQEICGIDGVIFSSAQHPKGQNIVLFGDASLVRGSATENEPQNFEMIGTESDDLWEDWKWEEPTPALAVADEGVKVIRIEGVEFTHAKIMTGRFAPDEDDEL